MTEPTELLPCPFCGGINIIHCCHHMYCHACGADGPDADSQCESEAIAAWNKRTPQPTQAQAGAVPLTEEQRSDIATAAAGFNWTDDYVEAIDYVIDGVESLHGIKGGQHGAE